MPKEHRAHRAGVANAAPSTCSRLFSSPPPLAGGRCCLHGCGRRRAARGLRAPPSGAGSPARGHFCWGSNSLFSAVQARPERPPKRCVRACAYIRALSCMLVPLLMHVMLLLLKLVLVPATAPPPPSSRLSLSPRPSPHHPRLFISSVARPAASATPST